MMIIIYQLLGFVAVWAVYTIIRFIWIANSMKKLHIAFAASGLNDLAILYLSGDFVGVMRYENPWAENIKYLVEDCGDRIREALYNPFFPWNKYRLLPTLNAAIYLKRQIAMGAATFNTKEYFERAKAFQEQLAELGED